MADYVTPEEVTASLTELTQAQIDELASVITTASRLIDRYLDRSICSASYDELHQPGRTRTIRLREYPVSRVSRIACGNEAVLTIRFGGDASRATVEMVTTGDAPNLMLTGLLLASRTAAVTTTTMLAFGTDATASADDLTTLGLLAAAIGGVSGWTASVASGRDNDATADLTLTLGAKDARNSAASLWAFTSDVDDYDLDPVMGRITLNGGWPRGVSTGFAGPEPFRFPDRPWGVNRRDASIRVSYTAGYQAVPADLKNACISVIQLLYDGEQHSGLIKSERVGSDGWEMFDQSKGGGLLSSVAGTLDPYRRVSLA